jgi:hypothetical protein
MARPDLPPPSISHAFPAVPRPAPHWSERGEAQGARGVPGRDMPGPDHLAQARVAVHRRRHIGTCLLRGWGGGAGAGSLKMRGVAVPELAVLLKSGGAPWHVIMVP